MTGRGTRRIVASASAAALLWPAIAWADKKIEAGPPTRFTTTEITMDQGERLVFHNGDTVGHDVTATAKGPDGKVLFGTPMVDSGKEAFVAGSQYLTEGHYNFFCSIHPNMKGSIHVTANGTPQQRPGTTGQPTTGTPGPADTTKPTVAVKVVSRTSHTASLRHALVVRVTLSEPGHVELRAVARPKVGGPLVTVATGMARFKAAGASRAHLKLTQAGRAAVRRHHSLAVVVTGHAMDDAGNKTTAVNGRTLAR